MKIILTIITAAFLLACNKVQKTPEASQTLIDSLTKTEEPLQPVYTPEEEARIKKDSLLRLKTKFPFIEKFPFEAYPAPVFTGTPAAPNFKGNPYATDKEYVDLITKGCKKGINFGGHYTIIERSCGAMCEQLFIVNRKSGKIFTGLLGLKGVDGYYGFKYEKDSFILITDATVLIDATPDQFYGDEIVPAVYEWTGDVFKKLE